MKKERKSKRKNPKKRKNLNKKKRNKKIHQRKNKSKSTTKIMMMKFKSLSLLVPSRKELTNSSTQSPIVPSTTQEKASLKNINLLFHPF